MGAATGVAACCPIAIFDLRDRFARSLFFAGFFAGAISGVTLTVTAATGAAISSTAASTVGSMACALLCFAVVTRGVRDFATRAGVALVTLAFAMGCFFCIIKLKFHYKRRQLHFHEETFYSTDKRPASGAPGRRYS